MSFPLLLTHHRAAAAFNPREKEHDRRFIYDEHRFPYIRELIGGFGGWNGTVRQEPVLHLDAMMDWFIRDDDIQLCVDNYNSMRLELSRDWVYGPDRSGSSSPLWRFADTICIENIDPDIAERTVILFNFAGHFSNNYRKDLTSCRSYDEETRTLSFNITRVPFCFPNGPYFMGATGSVAFVVTVLDERDIQEIKDEQAKEECDFTCTIHPKHQKLDVFGKGATVWLKDVWVFDHARYLNEEHTEDELDALAMCQMVATIPERFLDENEKGDYPKLWHSSSNVIGAFPYTNREITDHKEIMCAGRDIGNGLYVCQNNALPPREKKEFETGRSILKLEIPAHAFLQRCGLLSRHVDDQTMKMRFDAEGDMLYKTLALILGVSTQEDDAMAPRFCWHGKYEMVKVDDDISKNHVYKIEIDAIDATEDEIDAYTTALSGVGMVEAHNMAQCIMRTRTKGNGKTLCKGFVVNILCTDLEHMCPMIMDIINAWYPNTQAFVATEKRDDGRETDAENRKMREMQVPTLERYVESLVPDAWKYKN